MLLIMYQSQSSGPDWLLILLANSPLDSLPLVLLLLWRVWHLRNNIIHETMRMVGVPLKLLRFSFRTMCIL